MRPRATIQLTTIEFVMGKPNGLAISTAFCVGPCSASSVLAASTLDDVPVWADVVVAFPWPALTANAPRLARNMKIAVRSSDAKLAFNLGRASAAVSHTEDSASNWRDVAPRLNRCRKTVRIRFFSE